MRNRIKIIVLLGCLAGIATLAGCTKTKINECNDLITSANKLSKIGTGIETRGKELEQMFTNAQNMTQFKDAAIEARFMFEDASEKIDNAIRTEINTLVLTDEKLNTLRKGYSKNIAALSKSVKRMANIYKKLSRVSESDTERLEILITRNLMGELKTMEKAAVAEEKIIKSLNGYCGTG